MGLDMYLNKKRYIWGDEKKQLQITGIQGINSDKVKYIIEEAGYWRKANQIHKWFVDNVQEGEDDCKDYYVSREDLQSLLDTVNKVLEASELIDGEIINGYTFKDGKEIPNIEKGKIIKDSTVAQELLPTEKGFFFGGSEYDEYYYQDLVNTKEIIENVFKENDEKADYSYHSSW